MEQEMGICLPSTRRGLHPCLLPHLPLFDSTVASAPGCGFQDLCPGALGPLPATPSKTWHTEGPEAALNADLPA